MDTAKFLAHVLPSQGYKFAALRPAGKQYWRHKAEIDTAQLAAFAMMSDARGAETYFACASFTEPRVDTGETRDDGSPKYRYRTQENAAWVKSLWLDMDCGPNKDYPSQKDAARDVAKLCKEVGIQMPTMVSSGYGLHCYWVFDREVAARQWVRVAAVWRSAVDAVGVRHDPSCTTDVARILRVPGTTNRKNPDDHRSVRLVTDLKAPISLRGLVETLTAFVKARGVVVAPPKAKGAKSAINSDLSVTVEYPPADAEVVSEGCQQVAFFRKSSGVVPEPLWYAMLGLLKHTVNGRETCHAWSEGDPSYNPSATEKKIGQWVHGPTTCARLGTLNPQGCAGCPHSGKISSPIQLGVIAPPQEPVVEINEVTQEKESLPEFPEGVEGKFQWNGTNMVAYLKDAEGVVKPTPFADVLFYPESYYSKAIDGNNRASFSTWVVRERPNLYKRFSLSGEAAGVGGRELFAQLGQNTIFAKPGTKKHMEQYITEWFSALRRDHEEIQTYSTYGWHGEDFLIGSTLLKADGTKREVRVQGDAAKYLDAFAPQGDLDDWVVGIDRLYNRPTHEQFQWMFGVGFGAPLVKLWGPGMAGCIINGYSAETAQGKSTAGKLALGMYGNPDRLALTKQQSTTKGLFAYCGVMNSLPVLLDEITNAKSFELSELVYTFSQGAGRIGAQSDGSLRTNVYEWATLMAATSNRATHSTLASGKADARPEIARVFEYRFVRSADQMSKLEADNLIPSLLASSGLAGRKYMEYVVSHQDAVRATMTKVRDMLTTRAKLGAEDRFWAVGATTVLTGLMTAKKLGLVSFDMTRLTAWVIHQMNQMRFEFKNSDTSTRDHIGSMLNDLSPHFLVTDRLGDGRASGGRAVIIHPPKGSTVMGRVIHDEGNLYLPIRAVRDWCNEHQVDYNQMVECMTLELGGENLKTPFTLGRGTADYATAPSRCFRLNLALVGGEMAHADSKPPLARVK